MPHLYPFTTDPTDRPEKAAIKRCFGEDGLGWVVLFPVTGAERWDLVAVETTTFAAAIGVLGVLCHTTRKGGDPRHHLLQAEAYLGRHDPLALAGGIRQ